MIELTPEQINQLIESGNFHLHQHVYAAGSQPQPPTIPAPGEPQKPDTWLVQMTQKEAYKSPSGYNDAGNPILDKTIVGFRAEEGDILEVETEKIMADGGALYWRIWRGENDNSEMRGWYVSVSRTRIYEP
ncbi:MAG: hypothetical protein OEZ02_14370 [Anaerolineae bacterium]|nr:hypothetical protein [Anaerolineae bacterium]